MPADSSADPRWQDQRDILNQLGEFARILDSRRWADVPGVFADDVAFDYGEGGEQNGLAALTKNFSQFLDGCGPSQHLLGSIQLELDGDTALTRSYIQARHQGAGEKSDLYLDSNGEYIDRWERRAEGWRIVRRDAKWAMLKGDMTVLGS